MGKAGRDALIRFVKRLRGLRRDAGSPSLRRIEQLTKDLERPLPRATVSDKLAGKSLPDWDFVVSFVTACETHAALNGTPLPAAKVKLAIWDAAHRALLRSYDHARADDRLARAARLYSAQAPRQLPPHTPHFTGRTAELHTLKRILAEPRHGGAVLITAIDGMAGIGKTALAVHAAHILGRSFPDGQLFVDLHGFTAGMARVEPADALDRLLRDIGVPGDRIPSSLDERSALWRSSLAGRRMLIVLDNAAAEAQVQPLLPGAAGCLVMVTSRKHMAGLETTNVLSLDAMSLTEAVHMFVRCADRPDITTAMPEVVKLVTFCGRLPLAIRIAAARLKHRRAWTVAHLLDRLRDLEARLDALDDGHRSVHAALHMSYTHLPASTRKLYRRLGWHPGPEVDAHAAAALAGVSLDEAKRQLDGLVDHHLLTEPVPGRYRFHDLIRAHARVTAAREARPPDQRAALSRLMDHYRSTAAAAMDVAHPYERLRRPVTPASTTPGPELSDREQAKLWLDNELGNLLAAAQYGARHGYAAHVWHLSAVLDRHLRTRGRYRDAETLHQQSLDLARRLGDRSAEVTSLNGLGHIHRRLGRPEQAGEHYRLALRLALTADNRGGESDALIGLGYVYNVLGEYERAAKQYEQALRLAESTGDRGVERQALHGLGDIHLMLGHYGQADHHFARALRLAQAIGDQGGELQALNSLGSIHRRHGRNQRATENYGKALRIAQIVGDSGAELQALVGLGHAQRALGLHDQARQSFQRVLDLADELGSSNWRFEAVQGLGRVHHATGNTRQALARHTDALRLATDLAQAPDQARAHDGLAHAYHALGEAGEAHRHWQRALDILIGIGTDQSDDAEASVPNIQAHLTH